jgi:hypothetical protein
MVAAAQHLEIWSFRLAMERNVELDADVDRDPIARFIRVSTGEGLGELHKPLELEASDISEMG